MASSDDLAGEAADHAARTASLAAVVAKLRQLVAEHDNALGAVTRGEAALREALASGRSGDDELTVLEGAAGEVLAVQDRLRGLLVTLKSE